MCHPKVKSSIKSTQQGLIDAYQMPMEKISEVSFFDKEQGNDAIVKRLLRAMVLSDSFVYVVGGMSDTAGHGNMFADSYPQVMADIMAPAMEKAKIKFEVRNLAMGGVPSYPGSMCMKDAFGPDADVVMWDFRMVEHNSLNGEIYIRQALMHPRHPFVAFKRPNGYLNSMKNYFTPASLVSCEDRWKEAIRPIGRPLSHPTSTSAHCR